MTKKIKVEIRSDEAYPVYSLKYPVDKARDPDFIFEIPLELFERFQKAEDEYDDVSHIISKIYEPVYDAYLEKSRRER